ncbi:MAG TPA: GNAT family N-acetyltransferase, partial [Myxococcaceae bacterium]
MAMMVVEQVTDVERFAELRGAWEELQAQSEAPVFRSWAWLHAWYRRWSEGRRLFLLATRDGGGRLLGVLPLYLQERRSFGRSCRRLGLLGDERAGSDHLGPLVRKDVSGEVLAGWGRWLLDHRPEWDLLELLDVDEGDAWLSALRAPLKAAGLGLLDEPRFECPYDTFEPGLDFERYLARTKRAENYRRRRRWLERQQGYRIDRVERGDGLEEALETFFHLHRMRWREESAITDLEVEAFHREAAPWLASAGHLRLYTMRVGGRAVASVYALRGNGVLSYFNAGYDPAWRDKSVGLV